MRRNIMKILGCLVVISVLVGLVPLVVAEEVIPAEVLNDLPEDPDIIDEISRPVGIKKTEAHTNFNPVKTFSASSIGKKAIFTVHWETPICPVGYPCTLKPLVYANQDVNISGAVKNVGDEMFDCKLTVAVRKSKDNSIVYYAIKENTTHLDPLNVKNFTDIVANDKWLIWNTGTNVGEYHVWGKLEVIGGDTIQNNTPSFQIGKEERVEFKDFRTVNFSYQHNKIVNLSENATIVNIGNQKVSGTLMMKIWKYDNATKTWDKNFWIGSTASISLDPGEDYPLKDVLPSWDTNAHENGTYKTYMAIVDSSGNVKDQLVGTKPVGKMEITLPTVTVDKYVNPIKVSPGNAQTEVSLRVGPSGHSVRDSGVFMIGNITVSELDIVFVVDTSGSMNNEWNDLCNIIDDIVTELSDYTNITSKIYGLGWKRQCADDYLNMHSENWGPGTEYLANNYPWRHDAVRVIFPIGDEGPYKGVPNDEQDTQSVDAAIIACKANSVIAYPMWGELPSGWEGEMAKNIAHMERLADETGGRATLWTDTETAKELITESLFKEIKIAGKNISITENIIDKTGEVEPDWNSFKFDGNPIPQGDLKITPSGDIKSVTFDESYLDLTSITASPPEQHIISYTVDLPNLLAGETRNITEEGSFTYKDALTDAQKPPIDIPYAFVLTSAESDVIVVVDPLRLKDLYTDTEVNSLMNELRDYCSDNNGTLYNLSVYRLKWEKDNGKSAFDGIYNLPDLECNETGRWKWDDWPGYVNAIIHTLAIDRKVSHILLVGSDIAIPFHRISDPVGWEVSLDYHYITQGSHGILWSDFPYSDLNGDDYPDVSIARLIGNISIMRTSLSNAAGTHVGVGNNSIVAYKWADAIRRGYHNDLVNTLRNDWGLTGLYVFAEEDPATGSSIADLRVNGQSFLDRLDEDNILIYVGTHGNDYRDPGNAMHRLSDDHHTVVLRASNVDNTVDHPFFVTKACHGGSTYSDDGPNHNLPLAFLYNGAVGYVGATGYSPSRAGADFYSHLFIPKLKNDNTGTAFFMGKREMLIANNDMHHELLAKITHLYGVPTYQIDIPSERTTASSLTDGYIIICNTINNVTTINVRINTYSQLEVETSEGNRTLITIPSADLLTRVDKPTVPEIVETIILPSSLNLSSLLDTISSDKDIITDIQIPSVHNFPTIETGLSYSGKTLGLTELYPDKLIDYEVINEVDGNRTVVFRIFPLQYNESAHEAYLYKNITFGYTTKTVPPAPLVDLSVMKSASETTVNVGASTTVTTEIRNTGQLDANDLIINETLPSGFSASSISNSGVYDSTTNSITWNMDNLTYTGIENFKILSYELNVPNSEGTYDINTTVEYESEAGVTYLPINRTLTLTVFGGEVPPVVARVNIKPETLNLASKGVFTAFIQLPEDYNVSDINISTVVCEGAPAVRGMVSEEDNSTYIAKFNRQELVNVTTGDAVELTVTGNLYVGTPFEGSDTIRVIDKGKGK